MTKHTFLPNLQIHWKSNRAINSFKTAIACLIGYLLYIFTPLPQAQWIVITILVVMSAEATLGGLLIKSYMRFWGTVAGAAIAIFALLLGGNSFYWIALILFFSTLCFAYVAGSSGDASVAGVLGAVTIVMILLSPNPTLSLAGIRSLEIILGILISFLVSKFIYPVHAHTMLMRSFADTLLDLKDHFDQSWKIEVTDILAINLDLDEKITKAFSTMRKLLHATEFELKKNDQRLLLCQDTLNSIIKIYRAINMLYYSRNSSPQAMQAIQELEGLESFKQHVGDFLVQLSEALRSKKLPQIEFVIADVVHYIEAEFKLIAQQKEYEHIASVNAFLFSATLLTGELKKLSETVALIVNAEPSGSKS